MPNIEFLRVHPLCLPVVCALLPFFSLQAVELGATLNKSGNSTTSVTFRVWAPNARAVSVAGEFNGWNATSHPLGNQTINGTTFWTGNISNARPGHAYKYVITTSSNATLWKKDPRGRQVRTLNGAPGYVTANSSPQASVIYDKDAFDWSDDFFVPPEPKDVVMYELHIGTFFDPTPNDGRPATFDDAILKLDYLKGLGVNMIALMPVSEFNGMHSWGYNPTDLFAIEEAYGGPDAFKRFVKAAHLRDMAVQVDVVHNHYGEIFGNTGSNTTIAWESAKKSDLEGFDGGEPYFYTAADETSPDLRGISKTKWGPRPKYSEQRVRDFITDNIKMYLDEYKVWALRWDSPRNITGFFKLGNGTVTSTSIGDPDTQIRDAVTMMENIHREIASSSRPNSARYYSIAEDASSPGGYTGHWEISYHDAIFSWLVRTGPNGTLSPPFNTKYPTGNFTMGNIEHRIENREEPGFRVVFLENHDKCGDHNSATDGKRMAEDFDPAAPASIVAKKKTLAAAAATLTAAGTPMLWMGQEQLANGDFNDKKPLDWNRAAQFPGIVRFHRDLINLRKVLPALTTAGNYTTDNVSQIPFAEVVTANQTTGLLVYRRDADANPTNGNEVLVAMNFSNSTQAIPASNFVGNWTVRLNSDSHSYDAGFGNVGPAPGVLVANSSANVSIGSWGTLILTRNSSFVPPANDSNNNGIDDGWELLFSTLNATADPDADGFNNLAEFQNGTDPTVPDRASLPGTFNDWNTVSSNMRWDPVRSVWRHVVRFTERGTFKCKGYTAAGWAADPEFSLQVASAGTFEITYNPSTGNYTSTRVDADSDANGMSDTWEGFYFYPAISANASANPDGDAFTNLQEFQRGSDPTEFDYPAMGVVGGYNGWNWNARNMRYTGHGVWTLAVPFRTAPGDRNYKFGVGPTNNDDNWGDDGADGVGDYKSNADLLWAAGTTGWRIVRFNEKNLRHSLVNPAGSADVDADGMPDVWEVAWGLNPRVDDAAGDPDGDGVWNRFEYEQLRNPLVADRKAQMHIPGRVAWDPTNPDEAIWGPGEAANRMVWNPAMGQWEFVLYTPRSRALEFKFAAGAWENGSWGWSGTGVAGQAVAGGDGNILATVGERGLHLVQFEEAGGVYSIQTLPSADANANGMADAWERFHFPEGVVASADADGDGVSNLDEFRRGSNPRVADHFAVMNLAGDLNGWNLSANPMRWNAASALWELLLRAPAEASNQEAKFVAGTSWSNPHWGDKNADGLGDRNTGEGEGIRYSIPASTGYFLFRFDEFTLEYSAGVMTGADGDNDGLPDAWAGYHGVSGSGGNPDGDPFTNAEEFARGSDPNVADQFFKNHNDMRVVGDFTGWAPESSPSMMLVGDNLWRLDFSGFNGTSTRLLKFVAGDSWGAPVWGDKTRDGFGDQENDNNIFLTQNQAGTYRFEFNDRTLAYSIRVLTNTFADRYPGFSANQTIRGLPAKVEYLFGGTAAQAPPVEHLPTFVPSGSNVRLSFVRRTDDSSLNHVVEFKSDLASGAWQAVSIQPATESAGTNLQRWTYNIPTAGAARAFYRIRAW